MNALGLRGLVADRVCTLLDGTLSEGFTPMLRVAEPA